MREQGLYRGKKRRISLTALIDVVFILLLFFMLTTSFSHWRAIHVSTATGVQAESDPKTVRMLLLPDAAVKLYAENITFHHYQEMKLADLALGRPNESIVLLPHQAVPLQLLLNVTQHLKAIGLKNVAIGHSFGEELDDRVQMSRAQ